MFWYRIPPAAAAPDIVLPLKAQNQRQLPWQQRYLLVYVLFSTLALYGRSKDFCGLGDFPRNSHKKYIRPSFYQDPRHPVHRRFFPFARVTVVFEDWLPVLPVLLPTADPYDGSCVSQNGFSV